MTERAATEPRRGSRMRTSALRGARARVGRRAARCRRPQRPRRDAPLHGARHGRGGPRPVPRHAARHRPGDRGRLLLRLQAASPAHARRPRRDRGADGGERRGRPSVRPARAVAGGGPGLLRGAQPAVQGRDPRRPRREGEGDGQPMPPTSFYEHGPFIDLCKGPHVASTGKIGPVQAARRRRRVLARRREAARCSSGSTARSGRRQEDLDAYLWRRAEAKKRDHRRLGVQLDLYSFHDVSPGLGVLAPQGPADLADARRRDARAPGAPRLRGDRTPILVSHEALAAVRPLGPLPRQHVHARRRGPDVLAQADELPREHVHLPDPAALVPRPAAALRRVRPAPPERAVGRALRPDPRPPVHPGRRPRLRPAGPARRPRSRRSSARSARPTAGSGWSPASPSPREPDKAHRRPGALGPGRGLHQGRPRRRPACRTRSSPRTARSTRRRSTSTSTTPSAASGRWRRSRPT